MAAFQQLNTQDFIDSDSYIYRNRRRNCMILRLLKAMPLEYFSTIR